MRGARHPPPRSVTSKLPSAPARCLGAAHAPGEPRPVAGAASPPGGASTLPPRSPVVSSDGPAGRTAKPHPGPNPVTPVRSAARVRVDGDVVVCLLRPVLRRDLQCTNGGPIPRAANRRPRPVTPSCAAARAVRGVLHFPCPHAGRPGGTRPFRASSVRFGACAQASRRAGAGRAGSMMQSCCASMGDPTAPRRLLAAFLALTAAARR